MAEIADRLLHRAPSYPRSGWTCSPVLETSVDLGVVVPGDGVILLPGTTTTTLSRFGRRLVNGRRW